MSFVSQADFARAHGVSRKTVTEWKAKGYIVVAEQGVDVEASDARLSGFRLGRFREIVAPEMESPLPRSLPGPLPEAPAGNGDDVTPPEETTIDQFLTDLLAGRFRSQADAEEIKENALAAQRVLAFRREAGALVDFETAQTVLFEKARAFRDRLMNWPAQVGPLLAADLELPADKVTEALTRHVHDLLAKLGEPAADFSGKG